MIRLVIVVGVFILSMLLGQCSAQAQTGTSPNLVNITNQQGTGWTGTTPYTGTGGGYSGGSTPGYNSTTNTIHFGYTENSAHYAYALNQALRDSGMTITGYNYSWNYLNQGDSSGTLSALVNFTGTNGASFHNKSWTLGPTTNWTTVNGTENFGTNGMAVANIANFSLSFTGKDSRFWAGYYGPQVKDPSISLNYTVDPCVSNPLYSPSCAGYSNVINSEIIAAQSYAINQALNISGAGAKINGLSYGYDYVLGGTWCSVAGTNADGTLGCSRWEPSSIAVGVAVTKNDGSVLYSNSHYHEEQNSSGSIRNSHVFNNALLLGDMGGYAMADQVNGTGAVFNKFSSWQYTPDACVVNPLSSTTCSGYQAAYQAQMCAANPLYNSACSGYAEAMFTQQCTANPLSSPACPGYAPAYLTYQCSINPLYSTTCAGYEQANLNAQCIKDSLYSNKCEGYATAYAIKNLITFSDSTVSSSVNGALSDTAATKANDPATTKVAVNTVTTSINTDGSVSTGVSATGDTNVDKAIASKASTTNAAPAAVQLAPPPPPAQQQMAQNEQKGGGKDNKQEDRKDDAPKGTGGSNPPPNTNTAQASSDKPAAPTARQAIQERREAAAKAEAVEKGKNLAGEMGKASDLEAQKAVQNVVIQAMGFTPGFDAYSKQIIVQQQFYKPYQVYGNQKTIDNRANLRMFGGTDRLHNDMVESQYNKGK